MAMTITDQQTQASRISRKLVGVSKPSIMTTSSVKYHARQSTPCYRRLVCGRH